MIIICCICKRKVGERPPLDNKSKTYTYCDRCSESKMGYPKKKS